MCDTSNGPTPLVSSPCQCGVSGRFTFPSGFGDLCYPFSNRPFCFVYLIGYLSGCTYTSVRVQGCAIMRRAMPKCAVGRKGPQRRLEALEQRNDYALLIRVTCLQQSPTHPHTHLCIFLSDRASCGRRACIGLRKRPQHGAQEKVPQVNASSSTRMQQKEKKKRKKKW